MPSKNDDIESTNCIKIKKLLSCIKQKQIDTDSERIGRALTYEKEESFQNLVDIDSKNPSSEVDSNQIRVREFNPCQVLEGDRFIPSRKFEDDVFKIKVEIEDEAPMNLCEDSSLSETPS